MDFANYTEKALANKLRRQKQVRRNRNILIVLTVLIIVMAMLFVSFSTEANDKEHPAFYKYYKSIEISSGDTLWSIANANFDPIHYNNMDDYVAEIKRMNSLFSDEIVAGSYLIVPYYSSEFISSTIH